MVGKVRFDGGEMGYLRFGSGEKAMVILPGLSVQSVLPAAPVIEKQYQHFTEEFTVYLFDRRENLPPVYSVYDMAEDTAKAMRALGISGCCLYGVSQGGMIAMALAVRHPGLVSRLALGSTACRMDTARMAAVEKWHALAASGDAKGLYLAFGAAVYPQAFFEANREAFLQMAQNVTEKELARFLILADATAAYDISEALPQLSCPVLAVGDTTDTVLGGAATEEIAALLKNNPNAESYLYSGYGHAAYDMAPDFTERLYRFFTK